MLLDIDAMDTAMQILKNTKVLTYIRSQREVLTSSTITINTNITGISTRAVKLDHNWLLNKNNCRLTEEV